MPLPMAYAAAPMLAETPGSDRGPAVRLAPLFAAYVADAAIERAAVAGFDRYGRLRSFAEISGDAHAIADILPAIRSVLGETNVIELVIAHNHPSASASPSARDRLTTDRLAALARLAGALLIDHLVFGVDGIYSMAAGQLISRPAIAGHS